MVLNPATASKHYYEQQQKKRQSIDNSMIRFPKLDECAHFHYEFAELSNFNVSLIINEGNENNVANIRNLCLFVRVQSLNRSWTVRRNLQDFRFLDIQLHKCVFDRKHSNLKPLNLTYFSSFDSLESIINFVGQYLERLSQIVGGCFLTCGPVLHWFEIDNRGNRLINEDINTPAIGAAFVIKKHNKSDVETEISLEIGELVSVIEMPPVNESFYWKGKKGFEVGFFPAECVQLIDDKISRKTEELPLRPLNKCISPTLQDRASDIVPVADEVNSFYNSHYDNHHFQTSEMRKHGLIAALFRTFASGKISGRRRNQLKSSGILKERVFGCDLCEHLANNSHDLPPVLTTCCSYIEANGLNSNGIYRLSGVSSTIHRLRAIFDEELVPPELVHQSEDISIEHNLLDIHAVSSLLKLYFRELPNPLLTFSLYDSFVATMRDDSLDENTRLLTIRSLIITLPPPHWRTLRYLIRHLSFVSKFEAKTGMTPKNLAIVWAPNLLRSRDLDQHVGIEALHVIGTQAVFTEFLILNCDKIFDREEHEIHPPKSLYSPFSYPKHGNSHISSKCLKYIEVGPEIIPGKYHTIISIRPSTQSKRSKFNLQNLKKFYFFSARTHNGRHRPSLFSDDDSATNGGGTFRKLNNFDGNSSSESTGNFNYKSAGARLNSRLNKSVKRSESFDSYFKQLQTLQKLRANNIAYNNKNCSIEDSHKIMVDINRNKFDGISKTETIFEVEEMSIDLENHCGETMPINELNNNDLPKIHEESFDLTQSPVNYQTNVTQTNDISSSITLHFTRHISKIHETDSKLIDGNQYSESKSNSSSLNTSSIDLPETIKSTKYDTHFLTNSPNSLCNNENKITIEATESVEDSCHTKAIDSSLICIEKESDLLSINSPTKHSILIDKSNVIFQESHNCIDSDNVQYLVTDNSPSPTISNSRESCAPTTLTNASVPTTVTVPIDEEVASRERIERIKEERRNQIRQNFVQQMALKVIDYNVKSSSRIATANLPDIVNSSECSPVRLRNKPPLSRGNDKRIAWRNSEATLNDSFERSIAYNHPNISQFRRSVPNLESYSHCGQHHGTDFNSNVSSPTTPLNGPNLQTDFSEVNRKTKYSTSKSVDESKKCSNSTLPNATPRTKIAVTPLRTINKRARIIDPKELAKIFEKHNSTDN